jgi:hypothetical protein
MRLRVTLLAGLGFEIQVLSFSSGLGEGATAVRGSDSPERFRGLAFLYEWVPD